MTTVGELIAKLSALPQDLPVLVDGYEGGAQEPRRIATREFVADNNDGDSYCGPHEEIDDGEMGAFRREDAAEEGKKIFQAVIISRSRAT